MEEVVKLLVVLGSIVLALACIVDCGSVQGSNPNIAVVGQSLVVNWTYKSKNDPIEVTILVGHINKTSMLKLWETKLSNGNSSWTETKIDSSTPEAVFSNNTMMTNEGAKVFHLTFKSVPESIQQFRFACRVSEGIWSTPVQGDISIVLASPPMVDFKVRNSNGNHTVGGKLEISCAAKGFPPPIIKIKMQNSSKAVTLKSATESVKLTIDNLQPWHNGKYVCIANNIAGDMEKAVLVEVKYKPIVNFTVVTESGGYYVTMGKDVTMYCSADGFPAPKISMYTKENFTLKEIESSVNHIKYTISNVQPKDTKKFVCSASNVAGTTAKEKQLVVRYIQAGAVRLQNLVAKKGAMLEMICDVSGVPSPAFSWHKDGKKLSGVSVLKVKFDDDASFGKYTCKASNAVGDRSIVFAIKKIYIRKSSVKTEHLLKLRDKRTLHCNIDGHPIIKHTWYKGTTKISESQTLDVNLDRKDKFGNYTCVGKNSAGEEIILFSLKEEPIKEERGVSESHKTTGKAITIITSLLIVLGFNL